jgi:hypothetical protein
MSSARPSVIWDPSQLSWSMLCRADSIVGANGSAVASWTSRASDGQSVTQATGANKPTLVASNANFNGQPTVRFAGSQFMTLASMTFGTAGSNIFVWMVCRETTGGAISLVLNLVNASWSMQSRFAASNAPSVLGSSTAETDWGSAKLNSTISWSNYCDGAAGAGHSQNISVGNGTKVVTSSQTTVQSTSTMAVTLGAFTGGAFSFIGDIAEWGIMPSEPGSTNRALLETYAQARYGAG